MLAPSPAGAQLLRLALATAGGPTLAGEPQIEQAMKLSRITKAEMARRMETSRSQLDRLLDPESDSVTLATLARAARVIGRQVKVELV